MQVWQSIGKGVAAVAMLVSATSVINTIVRVFDYPAADWLENTIIAYRSLFYPMIEATFGRIAGLFDLQLWQISKDFITLYVCLMAAMMRSSIKLLNEREISIDQIIVSNPFMLVYIAAKAASGDQQIEEYISEIARNDRKIDVNVFKNFPKKKILSSYFFEISKVILIVLTALIFNSSGVLS